MLHSNIRATMVLYPFLDVTVYIYWRKRNNKNAPPTLDAYLYEGKREGGRVRTKNIGYLGTIKEFKPSIAQRALFWEEALARLKVHNLPEAEQEKLELAIALKVQPVDTTLAVRYSPEDKRGNLKQSITTTGLPPIPQKNYSLIVADPPWTYLLRESDRTHRNRTPYPNMSDEEIFNLPIGEIAAQNAYLLLWVTNNHLPLGFQCLETWGFTYKTIFTWLKVTQKSTSNEIKPRIGMGHYGRGCTEHFLVATKGKPKSFTSLGLTNIPNVILANRTDHSRKPEEFFVIANRLGDVLGGSRIELFARELREGWDAWGAEVEEKSAPIKR
ncbi:MAG TPA: MT-A70 family methyltransferase [Stenomitos sp.]